MLARYLGNKSAIMVPLIEAIQQFAKPGDHVVDGFSGSLSVSMALKKNQFKVTANDINLFSSIFAEAYLIPNQPPAPTISNLLCSQRANEMLDKVSGQIDSLTGKDGFKFLESEDWRSRYKYLVAIFAHLETLEFTSLPHKYRHTHFFDTYCEQGKNSEFRSARGTVGRRRFFTPENATRIDIILNQLRLWHEIDAIDKVTYSVILAALTRSVEKISNTQGTFHDFIREGWDSRALTPFSFELPEMDKVVCGVGGHSAGRERDTLEFIGSIDEHQVLYLDPPYNFRQYSAYYFLPNVICRYPEINDTNEYFSQIKYVRGQNPNDYFTSTFCKASSFINDLRNVITNASCQTVIISYFDGANHWSKFDSTANETGLAQLQALLSESMFKQGSQQLLKIPRRNYASYGGYTAHDVTELLLVAEKCREYDCVSESSPQRRLQLVA